VVHDCHGLGPRNDRNVGEGLAPSRDLLDRRGSGKARMIREGEADMRQMKRELKRLGGRVLLVLLMGSLLAVFCGNGVAVAQDASAVRTLPTVVMPGDEFEVTVTFTSPADDFSTIGLTDSAPAGWSVGVDEDWCTPAANASAPAVPWATNKAEYLWDPLASYNVSDAFAVVYRVRVPADAQTGSYPFHGTLEYYIGADGPYQEEIAGNAGIEVETPSPPNGDGNDHPVNRLRALAPWIALGVVIIAGVAVVVVRRRRA
jgi:hypothetical protein